MPPTACYANPTLYGGKAKGLLFLQQNGFSVPGFYIIPWPVLQAVITGTVQVKELVDEWVKENNITGDGLWAVRSSGGAEDGDTKSFAGLFDTEINQSLAQLPAAITTVLKAFEEQPAAYHEGAFAYHIVLQRMIASEYSGVAFSTNPQQANDPSVIINIIPGLGIHLVSGREIPLTLKMHRGKITIAGDEASYNGQVYDGNYKDISITAGLLQAAVKPYLAPLEKGVRKLARLQGKPADVEFTIANGQLYWLQLRPITAIENMAAYTVWDNANIGDNYPGLTLPLSVSFVQRTYAKGYITMLRFLGSGRKFLQRNQSLLQNMAGSIQGALYYNVSAWQQLLSQLPFGRVTSKLITRAFGTADAAFQPSPHKPSAFRYLVLLYRLFASFLLFGRYKKQYIRHYTEILAAYTPQSLEGKDHAELAAFYWQLEEKMSSKWIAPMLNGFFTMLVLSRLKKSLAGSRLLEEYPNFTNDILLAQGDVISVRIVRELQLLLAAVRESASLQALFQEADNQVLYNRLQQEEPAFFRQLQTYIEQYGERCDEGELKMETVDYKENPLRLLDMLRAAAGNYTPPKNKPAAFNYKAVTKKYYPGNFLRRWWLNTLVRLSIKRIKDRENFRFMRTKTFAIGRSIFRAIDRVLLQQGHIHEKGDSLYLQFNEIMNPAAAPQYRQLVAERKQDYAEYEKIERHQRYHQTGDQLVPVAKTGAVPTGGKMMGTGCSSGLVSGRVFIIDAARINQLPGEGYILVARFFEPGWINLFAKAGGLIAERGSLLSHTAILCRELGIPFITGAAGATTYFKDDDRITMNGATGEIVQLHDQ